MSTAQITITGTATSLSVSYPADPVPAGTTAVAVTNNSSTACTLYFQRSGMSMVGTSNVYMTDTYTATITGTSISVSVVVIGAAQPAQWAHVIHVGSTLPKAY